MSLPTSSLEYLSEGGLMPDHGFRILEGVRGRRVASDPSESFRLQQRVMGALAAQAAPAAAVSTQSKTSLSTNPQPTSEGAQNERA